jgi:uncharacterized protein (TIRG00374 family)
MTPVSSPRLRRTFRIGVGYAVAAGCLALVFHDVQVETLLESARELRWTWVALAIAVQTFSYWAQGMRWRLLLTPIGDLPLMEATRAIYAGLFASEVLPLRPGEVLRAFVASRRLNTNVAAVIPSIVVERLFDGVWLTVGIAIVAALLPIPRSLVRAGDLLGGLMLIAASVFLYEVLRDDDRPDSLVQGNWRRLRALAAGFRRRFQEIGRRRESYLAFLLSLAFLMGQVLAFWFMMIACGLNAGFWIGLAAFVIVHVGTAVPNAPANVGTYQFFCVVALTLFGFDKTVATGFSVAVFVALTVPISLFGALALGRSGATLASARATTDELLAGVQEPGERNGVTHAGNLTRR